MDLSIIFCTSLADTATPLQCQNSSVIQVNSFKDGSGGSTYAAVTEAIKTAILYARFPFFLHFNIKHTFTLESHGGCKGVSFTERKHKKAKPNVRGEKSLETMRL